MGPFVPEFISEQLNLVIALFLGMGFGFVLEQAGFSSSRRLAGVFYGYDFTVLRVFFTAAVTAMSGVILLSYLGFLDIDAIFVNPLWLRPAIVGGVIMGLGFILGGYCPGTSVCAASIGLLGVTLFGEFFPLYHHFFESTARGPVKVFSSLGISQGLFAFFVIVMAVGAFYATTRIEKKVAGDKAPSQEFPVVKHMAAGAVLLILGFVMVFMPDYKTRLIRKVANPSFQASRVVKNMVPDELAFRIVDQEPHTRILDLRPAVSFSAMALPGSVNLTQADLFGNDLGNSIAHRRSKKVIVADDEAQERQAYLLLQELGYENLAILEGGFPAFDGAFLHPVSFVPAGNRWDGDVLKFRKDAQTRIPQLIEAQKAAATKTPKKEKKIQGGC
jgi:hypothetical protein